MYGIGDSESNSPFKSNEMRKHYSQLLKLSRKQTDINGDSNIGCEAVNGYDLSLNNSKHFIHAEEDDPAEAMSVLTIVNQPYFQDEEPSENLTEPLLDRSADESRNGGLDHLDCNLSNLSRVSGLSKA